MLVPSDKPNRCCASFASADCQLLKHYSGMRENFLRILHDRGCSKDDIYRKLEQFPDRP
jgi:hypothetical protein